jgi:hypothetical protein
LAQTGWVEYVRGGRKAREGEEEEEEGGGGRREKGGRRKNILTPG